MYINTVRPHDADIRERKARLDRADLIEGNRGRYIRWLQNNGYSREQVERELAKADKLVEDIRERGS